MRTQTPHRGFTLLELVLVLVIICTALAVAAPSLRNWSHGSYVRNAADEFVAVTRYARTQAIATGQMYRLNLETGEYHLTIQRGEEFTPVDSDLGRATLAEGYTIELLASQQAADKGASIDFFPTGRTQPSKVRITSNQGESLEIECAAPTESFRVLNVGDTAR